MENMSITVLPKHLRGNSWTHTANPDGRRCPLEEALVEAGHKATAGGRTVVFPQETLYIEYSNWNKEDVERYIKAANEGSEESYTVNLYKSPYKAFDVPEPEARAVV